uniref:Uncharacterized protein n=1 Tax=Lactuca sativa TaxID=4236 RepID=A0A9R1V0V9_LACSA|nr:hypothetical protein LSAT_V11C700380240 [Lactuca sativa]
MILKDEKRAICRYNENEVLPNVERVAIGMQEYKTNKKKVHDGDIYHALRSDLMKHIYKAHIQSQTEYWHDNLFDESDGNLDMFIEDHDDVDEDDDFE